MPVVLVVLVVLVVVLVVAAAPTLPCRLNMIPMLLLDFPLVNPEKMHNTQNTLEPPSSCAFLKK